MMTRMTRRKAVQATAALAAALGLPGSAVSAAPTVDLLSDLDTRRYPRCPCRTPEGLRTQETTGRDDAWEFLLDHADPRAGDAVRRYDVESGAAWIQSEEHLVAALQAHLPGLAPAIGVVADHTFEAIRHDGSLCCEDAGTP